MVKIDTDFDEDDISDALMGIDKIMTCPEHNQAV